jgi:hypothetical protein
MAQKKSVSAAHHFASQVLLKRSKEMKITGCKMGMAGKWEGESTTSQL